MEATQHDTEDLPRGRNHTDDELHQILDKLDENELHGLKVGMLPARFAPEEREETLTGPDVARMMELSPKKAL